MAQLTCFMTSLQQLIQFHILLNSCLSKLKIIKLIKSEVERQIEYVYSVAVYQKKKINSVGRNNNFLANAQKLSILSTSLDIFDIQQHYIRILYLACIIKCCYYYYNQYYMYYVYYYYYYYH